MTVRRWVRSGTGGAPFVAVHTWHHETDHYARLSDALGGLPIVSILPPDPDHDPMPRRVDEWVDHCDGVLRTLDLQPPHRVVGWSFGGVVAIELARRLRARGSVVDFVGAFDSIRPILRPLDDGDYVWQSLATASELPSRERLTYLRTRFAFLVVRRFPRVGGAASATWRRITGRAAATPLAKPADPLTVSVHTAYLNYAGEPIPFPVHLYATQESLDRTHQPALRWLAWLHGGYELVTVPGGHYTMFDVPFVDGLAAAVARSIAREGRA